KGEGVLIGTDFLKYVNEGKSTGIGKRVLVIGGGNVALDCARVALRLGADEVRLACVEAQDKMPAAQDEIDEGRSEGIVFFYSRTCTRIIRESGMVTGAEFSKVRSFTFDEDGNIEIETIEDSAHVIETDTIIFAVGQKPEVPAAPGLNTTPHGLIESDPYTFETSISSVFAAGDAATRSSSVIGAISSGRKAAIAIDKFLEGNGNIEQKLAPSFELKCYLGPDKTFAALNRCNEKHWYPDKRIHGFTEIAERLDEQSAQHESERCLQCDLRLTIKPVKLWVNY
ncbi:MAG TPA: FAD-dependent oxidoreductase, partial [Syntrophorhabdaceae bacterium]|nr:FAD-dependent oxidoreductase [Syntrophorhabdaceae bacterium]